MKMEFQVNDILKEFIEAALHHLGELKWAYVILSKKNLSRIFHVTNYPAEWVKYYQENSLQYTDPVVITALNRLTPFFWDEKIKVGNDFDLSGIFAKAKKHSVINGFTCVLHDYKNNLATLSFIIDPEKKEEIKSCLNENKALIDLLLATVHEKYLALNSLPDNEEETVSGTDLFTERENEVLYWTSVGKTYPETGMILGIKTTTVKFHMSNIVKKLGVTNARHAVRLGVELQLVRPVR
ncbi:LuxR family transcriptional regulator [Erwinia sp. ACCC 02193]|uniref:LuxR family transcriptional regulator n=1 Tax=Erwinia aeris TaxID=3239803 RepID=A0ABV4E2P8_9GAMM|nr:LuxR family transcriptional regulator [Erwinia sp. BC051422]MDN8540119.1 LuxR family transcriptional regulator [Erwinia sp. BC051422]